MGNAQCFGILSVPASCNSLTLMLILYVYVHQEISVRCWKGNSSPDCHVSPEKRRYKSTCRVIFISSASLVFGGTIHISLHLWPSVYPSLLLLHTIDALSWFIFIKMANCWCLFEVVMNNFRWKRTTWMGDWRLWRPTFAIPPCHSNASNVGHHAFSSLAVKYIKIFYE